MAMDIRRNPLHQSPSPDSGEEGPRLLNEKTLRLLVFGGAALIVIVLIGVWYALGAPGAPEPLKRSLGRLPTAGDRLLPGKPEEPTPTPVSEALGTLSGLPCANARRRPIGVMLAADTINRPVSGFAFADAVFEMPVLINNVTRLLAVFQCQEPREIGSVRSARHDYLLLARGVDAVIVHWGGSYWALNMIRLERHIYDSLSALGTGNQAFFRKSNIPAPYNGFTSYARLWDALQKVGYRTTTNFAGYPHVDEAPPGQRGQGGTLDIGWPGAMRVRYVYTPQTNAYDRFWGGTRHLDFIDNVPVSPKVLVVVHVTHQLANGPGGYNDVGVEGTGKTEIYQNGTVIEGTWSKSVIDKQDPIHLKDATGAEIPFVRGQVWFHFVDDRTSVRWTPGSMLPPEIDTGTTPANLGG